MTNSVTPLPIPAPVVTIQRKVSIHFVADQEFLKCLQRAREILRPKYPEGRLEDIFNEALRLYLERKDPNQKYADKPTQPLPAPKEGRFIPASVKAAVWKRDNGRCTYTTADGQRCEARSGLEFDHKIPYAKGGLSIERNLRLLCRTHNQLEARREYGDQFIEKKLVPS